MFLSVFMDLLQSLSDMGICLCFTWLSHLWSCFISSSTSQDMASLEILPDDVMADVLSRLPADQVVNSRSVCKRWCSLAATPHFVQLHLERSTPVMYFLTSSNELGTFTLSSVDWSSKKRKQLIREIRLPIIEFLPSKSSLQFSGSCNGLFIFRKNWVSPLTYYIFNPIRREKITITPGLIVGFFLDSLTNKYELLACDNVMDDFRFYIGGLGPVFTWRKVGCFPYRPREIFAPSVVNGCLHWMAIGKRGEKDIWPPCTHSIMVFSIEHCEFRFLPHPFKANE
ncbi:F-box protein At3g07870-like [Rhodamnia argentea]|uniref:F-box protein At3g07870-like n=1 Tax=Rhodamnia argentea TaxID=178133 RepID=A0ABM3HW63_9MYRT|nr:F-box protein At3g07870-like [Rhodamnia argentea]